MEGLKRVERIGRGTFGEVYKAIDDGNTVAVKVIDGLSQDIDEIQQEIRTLSRCQHPNIIRYRRTVVDRNRLWIVMDYCEMGSLRNVLEIMGPLPEKAVAFVGREVLQALAYLHDSQIIHRDIKSANILLTADGQVRLGDFGVSGTTAGNGNSEQCTLRIAGSPHWMAPEVIRQSRFDAKADIWSFGITMFELLTGNPPLWQLEPGRAMKTIAKSMPPRLEANGGISKDMRDFVHACLHDDPDKRPCAKDLLRMKAMKAVKQTLLTDLLKQYSAMIEQQSDSQYIFFIDITIFSLCRSLLSKVTNFEQDSNADFWNFDETDVQQDPLLERYFVDNNPVPESDAEPAKAETLETTGKSSHQRTESQSSAGLSVGASSLLDSELDLVSGTCEAILADKLASASIHDDENVKVLTVTLREPEVVEEEGIMKLFPKIAFNSISEDQWKTAKQLLFEIKDLEERARSPLQVCTRVSLKNDIAKRQEMLQRLVLLTEQADTLLQSVIKV